MSKSYRKPYAAITGVRSAKWDKVQAHRGERAAAKQAIRECRDWDELLIPDRLECSHNDVWGWGRDGSQYYQGEDRADLHNPFFVSWCNHPWTEDEIMKHWRDRLERDERWQAYIRRK